MDHEIKLEGQEISGGQATNFYRNLFTQNDCAPQSAKGQLVLSMPHNKEFYSIPYRFALTW